jgi:hypothetical protein
MLRHQLRHRHDESRKSNSLVKKKNEIKNPLIYLLAGIGIAALLYGGWTLYQRRVAEEQTRTLLAAPAPSGIPDILNATPGPPPPP